MDGNYLGNDITEKEILTGERTVTITRPGRVGEIVVATVAVNLEEGAELPVTFRLEAAEDKGSGEAAVRSEQTGNLVVTSRPGEARVFLDGKLLGLTPLSLYGVNAGVFELSLSLSYYQPLSRVLRIEPNQETRLDLDLAIDDEDPVVKAQLRSPTGTMAAAGLAAAAQIAGLIGLGSLDSSMAFYPTSFILVPKFGTSLAGNEILGAVLTGSALTLSLVNQFVFQDARLISDAEISQSFFAVNLVAQVLLLLVDLAIAPLTTTVINRRLLESYQEHGFAGPPQPETIKPLRWIIQAGGGGIVHGGLSLPFFGNNFLFEQLLGVGLSPTFELSPPALSASTKLLWQPFPGRLRFLQPFAGGIFNVGTDFSTVKPAGGGAAGFIVDLKYLLAYLEVDLTFSAAAKQTTLAVGVKL